MDLAIWALRTSPISTTGVKYQFLTRQEIRKSQLPYARHITLDCQICVSTSPKNRGGLKWLLPGDSAGNLVVCKAPALKLNFSHGRLAR